MLEKEFDDCTPRYFVARLNGLRASQAVQNRLTMSLIREVCYYAAHGGNFQKGLKRSDIFDLPGEKARKLKEAKRQKEILKEAGFLKHWTPPEVKA